MKKQQPATKNPDQPATPHEFDLTEFMLDRQARNLTAKTLSWYAQSLAHWRAFATAHHLTSTESITPGHLRRFLVHLSQGHNAGGVANIFGALKAFLNWYEAENDALHWQNPLHKVKNLRRPQELLGPIALADFRALLAQCNPRPLSVTVTAPCS